MIEPNHDPGAEAKRPYEPPRVMAISLRPEEAVLGNCKISGSGGPVQVSCGVFFVSCKTIGS